MVGVLGLLGGKGSVDYSRLVVHRWVATLAVTASFGGCGESVDPTPEKLDGTPSYEFEQDDIVRSFPKDASPRRMCGAKVA